MHYANHQVSYINTCILAHSQVINLGHRSFRFYRWTRLWLTLIINTGSDLLFEALESGALTESMMESALKTHLKTLKDATVKQANNSRSPLLVDTLVITLPNYLCGSESPRDFSTVLDYYYELLDEVWPEIRFRYAITEGEAVSTYVTQEFDDLINSIDSEPRKRVFQGMKEGDSKNLLVVDAGGSSLNMETLNLYFKSSGLEKRQSSNGSGWLRGIPP